jgi:hypothetical protein
MTVNYISPDVFTEMTVNRKRPNISPDVFTEMSQLKKAEYFP